MACSLSWIGPAILTALLWFRCGSGVDLMWTQLLVIVTGESGVVSHVVPYKHLCKREWKHLERTFVNPCNRFRFLCERNADFLPCRSIAELPAHANIHSTQRMTDTDRETESSEMTAHSVAASRPSHRNEAPLCSQQCSVEVHCLLQPGQRHLQGQVTRHLS